MKKVLSKKLALFCAALLIFSCSDFEEINENPLAATSDQVEVEFFINASIGGAQQNPHIAERVFNELPKDAGIDKLPNYISKIFKSMCLNYHCKCVKMLVIVCLAFSNSNLGFTCLILS